MCEEDGKSEKVRMKNTGRKREKEIDGEREREKEIDREIE